MKQLRNTRTGKIVVYDEKILELGYYEVIDTQPEEVSAPAVVEEVVQAEPVASQEEQIKAVAQKLLKRKPKAGGGLQENIGASEKISIELTRG
jgi:hypothetical protein